MPGSLGVMAELLRPGVAKTHAEFTAWWKAASDEDRWARYEQDVCQFFQAAADDPVLSRRPHWLEMAHARMKMGPLPSYDDAQASLVGAFDA